MPDMIWSLIYFINSLFKINLAKPSEQLRFPIFRTFLVENGVDNHLTETIIKRKIIFSDSFTSLSLCRITNVDLIKLLKCVQIC